MAVKHKLRIDRAEVERTITPSVAKPEEIRYHMVELVPVDQAPLMTRVWMTFTMTRSINKATPRTSETANPPEFATYLLFLLLPKKQRDPLLGDLVEEYHEIFARFGRRKANVFYYSQVLKSWWPLLVSCAKNLAKAGIAKWLIELGFHDWVMNWLHKFIR